MICHLTCAGGAFLFLLGLLLLYLYSFTPYEAIRLASYNRYTGLYFLAWAMVAYAGLQLCPATPPRKRDLGLVATGVCVFAMIQLAPTNAVAFFYRPPTPAPPVRVQLQRLLAETQVSSLARPQQKIYILVQNSVGRELHMSRFELAPLQTNTAAWSIGPPYDDKDVWTRDLSREAFATLVREYDFLLLVRADAAFSARYGELFAADSPPASGHLYRIRPRPGGVEFTAVR